MITLQYSKRANNSRKIQHLTRKRKISCDYLPGNFKSNASLVVHLKLERETQTSINFMKKKINGNDALNFYVSLIIAVFSTFIGGAWFTGLILEPEKSENFLIMVSLALFLSGIGCSIYCFYLFTNKIYFLLYCAALVLAIIGYVLAVIGRSIYNNF